MKDSILVALIGTHGAGKTTAAYYLAAGLQSAGLSTNIVTEIARSPEFKINKSSTPEDQRNILLTQLIQESKASKSAQVVVCDRSIIDNYAYYQAAVEREILKGEIEADPYPWLAKMVKQQARQYDLLLVTEPDNKLVADGVRAMDEEFRQNIHDRIQQLLISAKLPTSKVMNLKSSEIIESQPKTFVSNIVRKVKVIVDDVFL